MNPEELEKMEKEGNRHDIKRGKKMHDSQEECQGAYGQSDDYKEKERNRTNNGRTTRSEECNEEENVKYIKNKIKSIEEGLEKEHEAMTELLIKIGLNTVQQWGWDNMEDNAERS